MSWIQENKFAATLGGVTALGAIVLFYAGFSYRGKYAKALQDYTDAAAEVEEYEGLSLYPSDANRDGKTKALNEYRAAIGTLQTAFDKYRPKEIQNISPQDFAGNAKTASDAVTAAFTDARTKLPEGFFLGFETYSSGSLAREEATGVLNYQLGAIKELMLSLAKAGASQVQNFHRVKAPEEDGTKWNPGPTDVSRALPVEVTFKIPEKGARAFLDALANSPNYFYTVRTLRLTNDDPKAPNKSDAKFESPTPAGGTGRTAPADPFGGATGFVLPEETPATPPPATPAGGTKPATPATPAPAATPAKPADSSRILNQILGDEEVQVFLRIDILQFLPVKELPAVPK